MNASRSRPLLIVLSAPSGTGKSTLAGMLLRAFPGMVRSVSCTTRPPRRGEKDGRDYFFITPGEFAARARRGEFLETACVHNQRYGTPRRMVARSLAAGKDVLLVIDVRGAGQVRQNAARAGGKLGAVFADVFLVPPNMNELNRRLRRRGLNTAADMRVRLAAARREMRSATEFRYVVVNDRLSDAFAKLRAIVTAEHCRVVCCGNILKAAVSAR